MKETVTPEVRNGTKGQHIANAVQKRYSDDLRQLMRTRDTLQRELDERTIRQGKNWASMTGDDNDLRSNGQAIANLYSRLGDLEIEIDSLYDQEFGKSMKKGNKKKSNTQKSVANKDKARKNRDTGRDDKAESLEKKCQHVDCTRATLKGQDLCDICWRSKKKDIPCRFGDSCKFMGTCRFTHPKKEAVVADKGIVDSSKRQVPIMKNYALVPLYRKRNNGFHFDAYCVKIRMKDNKEVVVTPKHVNSDGVFFFNRKKVYEPVRFKDHPIKDISVSDDPRLINMFSGSSFKSTDEPGVKGCATFCTRGVPRSTDLPGTEVQCFEVKCDGYVDGDFYCHTSDTYGGQCGSPYVQNGKVRWIHVETNGQANRGVSCLEVDILACLKV